MLLPLDGALEVFENNPRLRALHLLADLSIGTSYVAISLMLLFLVVRARNMLPFHHTFIAFGAFIIFCGLTHYGHVALLWSPGLIWPLSVAEALTVVASVATAVSLPPLLPRALALLRSAQLSEERLVAARAAQRIAADREELLNVLAHELRNPLAGVKGSAELLQRRLARPGTDPAKIDKTMRDLALAIERTERLLDDLADVSRIQLGRLVLRREPGDLASLAGEVVARWRRTAACTPRHRLVLDAPPALVGSWDSSRVEQVLSNLLANALKYSPEGGDVTVRLRDDGDVAVVAVSDEGVGISPDQQDAIFQPFVRATDGARAVPGEGIGLYVAAQIAERHGGMLTVESNVGVGSTFTLRLPKAAPERGTDGRDRPRDRSTRGASPVGT